MNFLQICLRGDFIEGLPDMGESKVVTPETQYKGTSEPQLFAVSPNYVGHIEDPQRGLTLSLFLLLSEKATTPKERCTQSE